MFFATMYCGKVFTVGTAAFLIAAFVSFTPMISPAQDKTDRASMVEVRVSVAPDRTSPGAEAVLSLQLKMPAGVHANSDLPTDPDQVPTIFYPKAQAGIVWGEPLYPKPIKIVEWYADEPLMVFQNGVFITVPLTIDKTVLPGQLPLEGNLHVQVCDREKCYPPRRIPVSTTIEVANDDAPSTAERSGVVASSISGLEFEFVDFDGRPGKFSQFRGKVVLLDFWATWCKPCLADIPKLKELYDKYNQSGFEILGMSSETIGDEHDPPDPVFAKQTHDRAKQIVKSRGMNWTHATSDTAVPLAVNLFGVKALPTKILVDKEGKIVTVIGEKDDFQGILEKFLSPDE